MNRPLISDLGKSNVARHMYSSNWQEETWAGLAKSCIDTATRECFQSMLAILEGLNYWVQVKRDQVKKSLQQRWIELLQTVTDCPIWKWIQIETYLVYDQSLARTNPVYIGVSLWNLGDEFSFNVLFLYTLRGRASLFGSMKKRIEIWDLGSQTAR